jgi:hypothetical protein
VQRDAPFAARRGDAGFTCFDVRIAALLAGRQPDSKLLRIFIRVKKRVAVSGPGCPGTARSSGRSSYRYCGINASGPTVPGPANRRNTMNSPFASILSATGLVLLLGACGNDGPAEQAGEDIDQAVEDVAGKLDSDGPAEKAGENVDKAVEKAGDEIEAAADELEQMSDR